MSQNTSQHPFSIPESGKLFVPMTNDYLFRALLQKNNYVLKGLLCSLLHLDESEVASVTITNPIQLGEAIDDKEFILDINVDLNHCRIVNIEMQVINLRNWPDRSLCYLSRSLNQLKHGDDYQDLRPVIQISLLDYTLFPECPEFYATYQLLNVKTHTLYSDKVRLSVLDLTRIDLATEEDRQYQIDHWASLFSATTWEELKMLAQDNDYIKEASETVYHLTQEEKIRQRCQAREDYYHSTNGLYRNYAKAQKELAEKDQQLSEKDQQLSKKNQQLSEKDQQLSEQSQQLSEQSQQLSEKDQQLAEMSALIDSLKSQLSEANASNHSNES